MIVGACELGGTITGKTAGGTETEDGVEAMCTGGGITTGLAAAGIEMIGTTGAGEDTGAGMDAGVTDGVGAEVTGESGAGAGGGAGDASINPTLVR